jgi:hypothetical protein
MTTTTSTDTGFLGSYDFDGDPDVLVGAYDRLMAQLPEDAILLNVCYRRASGITILDACPDRQTFAAFSTSDDFAQALAGVGLPSPTVTQLGQVHRAAL